MSASGMRMADGKRQQKILPADEARGVSGNLPARERRRDSQLETPARIQEGWSDREEGLHLRPRPQPHLPVVHFDDVLHPGAAVLFADFVGFLFYERAEAVERAGNLLSGLFLGIGQGDK